MPNGGHWHTQNREAGKRARRRADTYSARARRLARGAAKMLRKRERATQTAARWF